MTPLRMCAKGRAGRRVWAWLSPLALALCLAGCASEPGQEPDQQSARAQATNGETGLLAPLVRGLATAVISGPPPAPEPFTATRASLAAAGFDAPLLTVEVREPDAPPRKAGLLPSSPVDLTRATPPGAAIVWRGGDGGGITTQAGIVVGTAGLLEDLYGADAPPTLQALAGTGAPVYRRVYRFLTGDNQIRTRALDCEMASLGPVQIDVLGRSHATEQFKETCVATAPGPLGGILRFENRYWRGFDGTLWRSEQWVSPKLGQIRLEQVFL